MADEREEAARDRDTCRLFGILFDRWFSDESERRRPARRQLEMTAR